MPLRNLLFAVSLAFVFVSVVRADNWPEWRGPDQNLIAAAGDFPLEWGEDSHIAWKTPVPGWGTSTPVIWENQVFMTCEEEGKNALICLDRDGKQQWLVTFGDVAGNRNRKASGTNPSAVTDGQHVYGYYKSGDLACVDLAGSVIWQTNLQESYGRDRLLWDLGTSPVLTREAIIVAVMHQGPSYVVALEKATGKEMWKQARDLGAPGEARDSYTTPLVIQQDEQELVVILGADHLTAYAASSGQELWRVGNLNPQGRGNFRSIASPLYVENMIVAPYSRGDTLTAVRLGGSGDVTASHVAWTAEGTSSDVPTPIAREGRIYVCSDRGEVMCIELETGREVWTERLPRNRYPFSSSPVIAGDRLYATREDGTTFVLGVGDQPKLLATNALRENTYATPAFADGRIYLRTSDYLFCIE